MMAPSTPERSQILNELARIRASAQLAKSEKLSRLLEFIVLAAIDGPAANLKETAIGVGVFDKLPDYDTRTDPIVRVQARRLRSKLDEYYAAAGASDEVRISIPKGAYAPEFVYSETAVVAEPALDPPPPSPASAPVPSRRPSWGWPALAAAILLVALALLAILRSA